MFPGDAHGVMYGPQLENYCFSHIFGLKFLKIIFFIVVSIIELTLFLRCQTLYASVVEDTKGKPGRTGSDRWFRRVEEMLGVGTIKWGPGLSFGAVIFFSAEDIREAFKRSKHLSVWKLVDLSKQRWKVLLMSFWSTKNMKGTREGSSMETVSFVGLAFAQFPSVLSWGIFFD